MLSATVNLYRKAYAGLNHRMWLLAVVMFINRSGTMVLPFMTLYCKHIGFTAQQGGLVVAIYGIGAMVGAFVGGKISDRFGFYYTVFLFIHRRVIVYYTRSNAGLFIYLHFNFFPEYGQ